MSSLSIRNMNHSQRYHDELAGRAAPMTAADKHNAILYGIRGALNMARYHQAQGDWDNYWNAINVAYRLDAKLLEEAEDTRSMIDF